LFNFFGTEDYAREELTAELTAAYLCNAVGYKFTLKNSAAYIDGWIAKIKSDSKAFVKAAAQASTAFNYISELTGLQDILKQTDESPEITEAA